MNRGKFIVFEGTDGSGKSSLTAKCVERLRAAGRGFISVREPGGTPFGESVRKLLLNGNACICPRSELFLFMACRAQLVRDVIRPALESGSNVICDRFLWSSAAYQGRGLGLGVESVLEMGAFATEGLEPDLYIVVDVPYEVAITRRGKQQDDIEKRDREFFERVRGAYRELVAGHPSTSVLLDGTFPLDVVFERAWHEVMGVLEPR